MKARDAKATLKVAKGMKARDAKAQEGKTTLKAVKARITEEEEEVYDGNSDLCYSLRPYLKFLEQQRLQCRALMSPTDYQTALELIHKSMLRLVRREVCDNILDWQ